LPVIRLQNLEDPRLRVFSSYTDGQLRDGRQMVGLARDVGLAPEALAAGVFVAESRNVIERAMAAGCVPFALLVEECWEAAAAPLLQRLAQGCEGEAASSGAVVVAGAPVASNGGGAKSASVVEAEAGPAPGAEASGGAAPGVGAIGGNVGPGAGARALSAPRTSSPFGDLPMFVATRAQVEELTGFQRTRGPLAAFLRPALLPLEDLLARARRVAVLEGVTNYTNIGAIFRSAAALGVDAVLLDPTCHDPLYRRAARVSMGTVFQVPWGRISALGQEGGGLAQLAAAGFQTVALALADGAIPISDERLNGVERLALVLGNEEHGLAPATIAACDHTAIIPMAHGVDSLNVAAASAVAFWETRAC